jgi:putative PEP-CTERM system histidine kinase
MSDPLYLLPAAASILLAVLVLAVPRFGRTSWLLSLYLLLPGLGFVLHAIPGDALIPSEWKVRISFVTLLPALPAAVAFLWGLDKPTFLEHLRSRAASAAGLLVPIPILGGWMLLRPPVVEHAAEMSTRFVALGPGGYFGAIYFLVLAVTGLANVEQILRSAEERIRWEIKFLLLGLAGSFASVLYIASKVLLYPIRLALLPVDSFLVFPIISICSAALIFISWRRSSGRGTVRVSQSFVYSSITLLSVGIYLIISSLLARLASQVGESGVEVEAVVFLLSALAMGGILLWTGFRHRARQWIRRNIFAGSYDYRQCWMEAAEKIRSVDPPEVAARALAEVTQNALGAIDVTAWMRERNPNRFRLLSFLGSNPSTSSNEVHGIVEMLGWGPEVIADYELGADREPLRKFMRDTHASLLVPLVSSDRLVGVLTVGSDRSGQPYHQDARDFLRVLGGHAAGEFHKSELLSTLVEAKEAEAFRNFSTFLLHDLKNFASTLSLIAKNAVRHQDNPDFQRDAFGSVHETAEKMKRLCNSLKTFSGNLAANRRVQNLSEIVRETATLALRGADQTVRLTLADHVPVFVDREEIARMLHNLLINAREATPAEGEISVSTAADGTRARLEVRDSGRGISPEFIQHELFHPFHTTKSDGLGIGLFQCKKIVEAHSGTIAVESNVGVGTVVRIQFPCASDAASAGAAPPGKP